MHACVACMQCSCLDYSCAQSHSMCIPAACILCSCAQKKYRHTKHARHACSPAQRHTMHAHDEATAIVLLFFLGAAPCLITRSLSLTGKFARCILRIRATASTNEFTIGLTSIISWAILLIWPILYRCLSDGTSCRANSDASGLSAASIVN